ncbi:MAG: response regulator [Deltaproteobacteria bacterium]|nr:MAG: response regulator [Deltaproteobacteria bacterium]
MRSDPRPPAPLLAEGQFRGLLEEEQSKLIQLIEHSSDFIGLADMDGHVLFLNRAGREIVGLDAAEVRTTLMWEFVMPEDLPAFRELAAATRRVGHVEQEFRARHFKTGRPIPIMFSLFLVRHEETGEPLGYASISRDITELKRTEDEVARQARRIRSLCELAARSAGTSDADVEAALRLGCEWFGMEFAVVMRAEGARYTVSHAWTPGPPIAVGEEGELTGTFSALALAGAGPLSVHHVGTSPFRDHPAHAVRGIEAFIGVAIVEHEQPAGTLTFASRSPRETPFGPGDHDMVTLLAQWVGSILGRQRAQRALVAMKEAAEAANRAKSEFLANVSHEIRTPMTAILGYADLLSDPGLAPPEQTDYLDTIRRNGEHLLTVLNDILDLSQIEAGKLTLERVACSPMELVEQVASLMRVRALHKKLAFAVEYAGPIPSRIQVDPTRLRQILLNLVGNAIKFTEVGEVRLRVGLAAEGLRFEVSDTGVGIAPEAQGRLFQPFTQVDASPTRRFGGTGLGLMISKRLVEMLGGTIAVESTPGRGSTFRVTIDPGPLAGVALLSGPAADAAPQGAPLAPSAVRLEGCRVLVAEDGVDNQRLISFYLRKAGAEVVVAENGEMACARVWEAEAAGRPFAVVLMDMQMPVLDGYAATTALRARGYGRPIVALTAHAMEGDWEKCRGAGCDDFLSKPMRREALLETVARHAAGASRIEHEAEGPVVSALAADPDLRELVAEFVGTLGERVAVLTASFDGGDLARAAVLAHQLTGAAGGYGFSAISVAARRLEQLARGTGDVEAIRTGLRKLTDLCHRASPEAPRVTHPPRFSTSNGPSTR